MVIAKEPSQHALDLATTRKYMKMLIIIIIAKSNDYIWKLRCVVEFSNIILGYIFFIRRESDAKYIFENNCKQ